MGALIQKKRARKSFIYGCWQGVMANKPVAFLSLLVFVQLPFVVMHFVPQPRQTVKEPSSHPTAVATSPKSGGLSPSLPYRKDPFQLLPGTESAAVHDSARNTSDDAAIFKAFRGSRMPMGETADTEGNNDIRIIPTLQTKPLSLPELPANISRASAPRPSSPAAPKSSGIRLVGAAKFHGRSMAVFQLHDKTTVQIAEGDHLPGAGCTLKKVFPDKVLLSAVAGAKSTDSVLLVGEEYGK